MPKSNNPLIKSKDRVKDRGEVFTAYREVQAMCDLIPFDPNDRYLEPACGNGNFVIEVFRRKYEHFYYQGHMFPALSAASLVYAVDIAPDNVAECRERLFTYATTGKDPVMGFCAPDLTAPDTLVDPELLRECLNYTIVEGDFLTMTLETLWPRGFILL